MKIEKITVFRHDLIPQSAQGEYVSTESTFDPETGLLLQDIRFTPDGQVEEIARREYDLNGFLALIEVADADGSLLEKRSFENDSKGRTLREFVHYADSSADRIESTFDEDGNLIRREQFDDTNEIETTTVFEYHNGNLIRETEMEVDGNLLKERVLVYTEQGLIEEETVVDYTEDVFMRKEYNFDEDGKVEDITTFNKKGEAVERMSYSYNQVGKPATITEETKTHKLTITLAYHHSGEVVLEEEVDHRGQLLRKVEREIDENGLVIETKVFSKNLAYGITRCYILKTEYSFKN